MKSVLRGILTPVVTKTITAAAVELAEVYTTATLNVIAEWLDEDENPEPPQSSDDSKPNK
jgi:hypothetical protein